MLEADYTGIHNYLDVVYRWVPYDASYGDFDAFHESRRRWVGNSRKVRMLNPMTEAFVYATMSIGIGHWTHDNAAEVYARLKIIESLDGDFVLMPKDGERRPVTFEDVRQHIGFRVNVNFESRKEWAMRMFVGRGDFLKSYGEKFDKRKFEEAAALSDRQDVSRTTRLAHDFRVDTKRENDKLEAGVHDRNIYRKI